MSFGVTLVAIPYSSGMLLLQCLRSRDGFRAMLSQSPIHRECFCYFHRGYARCVCRFRGHPVAIPYSSGMLLLLPCQPLPPVGGYPPTSQSPIHRECFCYVVGSPRGEFVWAGRNPLFIGNAFATADMLQPTLGYIPEIVAIPYSSGMLLLLSARTGA